MKSPSFTQNVGKHDAATHILDGILMQGSLDGGDNPVIVDGRIEGDITATELTLREHGSIDGKVNGGAVTIAGTFKGELECDSLTIAATALVEGNVRTNALSIDMGAEVLGSISRIS